MRRLLPLAALAAALTIPAAAQPSFQWARAWGGTGVEYGYGLAAAPGGDVFVAGSFAAGVRFGPDSLVSAGSADILLLRLAPDGTVRWARRAGSNRADFAYAVETGPNGSVYVGGTFTRSIGFGTGDSLYANGNNRDAFVARYTGDGVYQWGWTGGGVANDDYLRDLVVEPDGGFYAAGDFHTAATIGGGVVQSAGLGDAWLARVRPDRSLAWIRTGGGTSDEDTWRTVAAAPGGGVYVAGTFRTRAGYTDPSRPAADTLVSRGSTDIAAARYGADGRLLWTRAMGGGSADFAFDGATMTDGDFVLAGILGSTGGVFGAETLTTAGKSDALAVRLAPDGAMRWVRLAGGPEEDSWRAAAALAGGAALIAGNLNTPSTVGAVALVTQGSSDLVAATISAAGVFGSGLVSGGGSSFDVAYSVTARDGAAYVTGTIQGTGIVFGGETFASRGVSDLVVARIRGGAFTGAAARETARGGALRLVGPNPVGAHAAVAIGRSLGDATVTLHDALGRTVARLHGGPLASGDEIGIDTSALAPGVYAVRLVGGGTVETRTFVVAR